MFSFVQSPKININFTGSDSRATKKFKISGQLKSEEVLLYRGSESVSGHVEIILPSGRPLETLGVKIELIGQVGMS